MGRCDRGGRIRRPGCPPRLTERYALRRRMPGDAKSPRATAESARGLCDGVGGTRSAELGTRGPRGLNLRPENFFLAVYQGLSSCSGCLWSGPGSIRRPHAFQARALPTELPDPSPRLARLAVLTGFEPATSGLTGRRALQTAPQDPAVFRTPNGIRTRVTALKGRRPRPLDDGGRPSGATQVISFVPDLSGRREL